MSTRAASPGPASGHLPPSPARCPLKRRAGLTLLEAIILLVGLACGFCLLSPALLHDPHRRSSRVKCANNLRQLALAAIQYADDNRFFPHVGPLRAVDGGPETDATPRTVRALVWSGYHDNPEGFICPSSYDLSLVMADAAKTDTRRWFWGGEASSDPDVSPFVDGLPDPTLDATSELSYGWTRRGLNLNARSSTPLGADRAQADPVLRDAVLDADVPAGLIGNHDDGSNVVFADGSASFVSATDERAALLADVDDRERGGFLAVRPPRREAAAGASSGAGALSTPALRVAGVLAVLLLPGVLVVLLLRRLRGAPPTPPTLAVAVTGADAVIRVRPSRVETLGPDERLKLGLGAPPGARSPVVLQHQQRCPACHDVVRADDALSRCLACRAVFHGDCVPPGGECTTLGCRGG